MAGKNEKLSSAKKAKNDEFYTQWADIEKEIMSYYDGVMGVPISFMDKYCPEQFEIVGIGLELADMSIIRKKLGKLNGGPRLYVEKDGELVRMYERILIRKRAGGGE